MIKDGRQVVGGGRRCKKLVVGSFWLVDLVGCWLKVETLKAYSAENLDFGEIGLDIFVQLYIRRISIFKYYDNSRHTLRR
jgi:hypothetical protein